MVPIQESGLPTGFISVDEGVALIKSDTRENPVVDMDYLASHVIWLDRGPGSNFNFRIPRIRQLKPEEVYRTRRGKWVEYEWIKDEWVRVSDSFERELLRKTILDKYRELVGREYQLLSTKSVSTVADDAQGRAAVQPRMSKPIAKAGQTIGAGETITTNGEGLLS